MNGGEILIWTHIPYTLLLIILLFGAYKLRKNLKRLNIESIEEICCYTEPKISASEYVFRKFSIFGKTFWHENLSTINN